MGKTIGFMDYGRCDAPLREASERVRDWGEFHLPLAAETSSTTGGTASL